MFKRYFSFSKRPGILLLAIALWGLVYRIQLFAQRDLWLDEFEQYRGLGYSFKGLLTRYLPGIPAGFPGDYLITWPLFQFSENKWIVTSPHILLTLLSFFLIYKISSEESTTWVGPTVTMTLFALNQNLAYHALEIRTYAPLPALALGAYILFKARIDLTAWTREQWREWILFWSVAFLFHAYGTLLFASLAAYFYFDFLKSRTLPNPARRVAVASALAFLVVSPIWVYYAKASQIYTCHVFEFSGQTPLRLLAFMFGNLGDLSIRHLWILELPIFLLGLVAWPSPAIPSRLRYFLCLIVFPIIVIGIMDYRHSYWFLQRQFIWVMPFWALLIGNCADSLADKLKRSPLTPPFKGESPNLFTSVKKILESIEWQKNIIDHRRTSSPRQ